jgi:ABC-type uncharacterized transport system substrate-binding protein
MRRREFITLLGGAAAGWPLAGWAQQGEPVRRIGVLMGVAADGPEGQARVAAFLNGLQQFGWTDGRNVRIDYRWGAGDAELIRNPVGAGVVESLARPGRNFTGFLLYEYGLTVKWLELLKEIAPGVKRVAVIREAGTAAGTGQFAAIQAAAPALGVELSPIDVRDVGEIERAVAAFARSPNGGLIVTGSAQAAVHRDLIITLAARHKLPAVYVGRFFVAAGGLISYGWDIVEQHRHAAGYVDRILKGEKPADLPVQAPTKYELVINLKTAKALGLTVPPSLLARADGVIE